MTTSVLPTFVVSLPGDPAPYRIRFTVMRPKELTARGLVLGILITTIFTAANVYLGLKVGLTFATSIPAAVISMALLSLVRDSSSLENNIVQTVASAAGTLSAIIFVLPGLVIVGWWKGFPFWTSALVCVSGGVLGVLYLPRGRPPTGVILYLHGGGYIGTSPRMYAFFTARLCRETQCAVFVADYRLAPEFP